jgi:hypothetical protein
MAFSLDSQMAPDGGSLYYTDAYQTMIETHLQWLLSHPATYQINIEPGIGVKYEGDLYGLLRINGIPPQHFWTVMRMNGMRSTTDYESTVSSLLVPNYQVMSSLFQVFVSTRTQFG